jgi:hypothetical protein
MLPFDTPTESGTYALRISAGTVIHGPDLLVQHLVVFINELQISQLIYTEPYTQFHECTFTHEAFSGMARTTVRFLHPDAVRPCDIGPHDDRRRLAFNFKRLSLVHLLPIM